ncbi:MAG: oligosaccharide flippase family protein [Anaerolineales bacterium]|nr:oligosaccharide flippase family protein [Anaerolineales bacterium]
MSVQEDQYQVQQPLWGLKILRGSLWLWLQVAGNLLLSLVFSWIILHQLSPAGFGQVVLVQSILDLANLGTLNLETSLQRLIPEYRSGKCWNQARQTVSIVLMVKLFLSGLAALIIFLAAPLIAEFYATPALVGWLRIGCVSVFFAGLSQFGNALCLGILRPEFSAVTMFIQRLCEVLLLGFFLQQNLGVAGVILALGIGDTIAALSTSFLSLRHLWRESSGGVDQPQMAQQAKTILAYSLPLFGATIIDRIGVNLNKLLIGKLAGATLLGLYGVARLAVERILPFLWQVPQMSIAVLAEKQAAKPDKDHDEPLLRKIFRYQWSLGSLGFLAIWSIAPLFVSIVSGEAYLPAVPVLRLASLGIVVWSGYICSTAVFQLYRRTLGNLLVMSGQFVVTYAIYLALVPSLNIYGAVLGDIAGVIAALVLSGWLLKRWFKLDLLRQNRSLGGQVLLLAGFILPAWLIPSAYPLLNIAWLAISFVGFMTYLLMINTPASSDLRSMQAYFAKPGVLNRIVFYGIGRGIEYQGFTGRIKQALEHRFVRNQE